jgi:hypothetical protein
MKDHDEINISGNITHSNKEELTKYDDIILYYVMVNFKES